ncbi:MAG: ribosome maturation factor RimM [Spirochaetaceae bacterium]
MDEALAVGVIRTSHGVRGYVKVSSLSGEVEHLLSLKTVLVRNKNREKEYRVEDTRPFKKGILLKLEGIETPEEGKALAGAELWVDREEAAPLAEEEYYIADLIGCDILCGGSKVAVIVSVGGNGFDDLMEVKTDKGIRIIPFTSRFIGGVDLEEGTVELLAPELLE